MMIMRDLSNPVLAGFAFTPIVTSSPTTLSLMRNLGEHQLRGFLYSGYATPPTQPHVSYPIKKTGLALKLDLHI